VGFKSSQAPFKKEIIMLSSLLSQTTLGFASNIASGAFIVFTALINILLILTAGRIIYAAIKGEPMIPESVKNAFRDFEYHSVYADEEKKYHKQVLRERVRREISGKYSD
jgi:hypothetical protein